MLYHNKTKYKKYDIEHSPVLIEPDISSVSSSEHLSSKFLTTLKKQLRRGWYGLLGFIACITALAIIEHILASSSYFAAIIITSLFWLVSTRLIRPLLNSNTFWSLPNLIRDLEKDNHFVVVRLAKYCKSSRLDPNLAETILAEKLTTITELDMGQFKYRHLHLLANLLNQKNTTLHSACLTALGRIGNQSILDDLIVFLHKKTTPDNEKLEIQACIKKIESRYPGAYPLSNETLLNFTNFPMVKELITLTARQSENNDTEDKLLTIRNHVFEQLERGMRIQRRKVPRNISIILIIWAIIMSIVSYVGGSIPVVLIIMMFFTFRTYNPFHPLRINQMIKKKDSRVIFKYLTMLSTNRQYSKTEEFVNAAKVLLLDIRPEDSRFITHFQMKELLYLLDTEEIEFQLAALKALSYIGREEHINQIEYILRKESTPDFLVDAVNNTVKQIRDRCTVSDPATLLRASTENQTNNLLLPTKPASDTTDLVQLVVYSCEREEQ